MDDGIRKELRGMPSWCPLAGEEEIHGISKPSAPYPSAFLALVLDALTKELRLLHLFSRKPFIPRYALQRYQVMDAELDHFLVAHVDLIAVTPVCDTLPGPRL